MFRVGNCQCGLRLWPGPYHKTLAFPVPATGDISPEEQARLEEVRPALDALVKLMDALDFPPTIREIIYALFMGAAVRPKEIEDTWVELMGKWERAKEAEKGGNRE